MRKSAPAAFLLSGALVFGGLFLATPAQADDDEDEVSNSEVNPGSERGGSEEVSEQHPKRVELELKYGKEGRLSLPPILIRPKREADDQFLISEVMAGTASAGFVAINPAAKDLDLQLRTGTLVDPSRNTAIDISKVKITKRTPADVFIQAAQVGLYAMAAGALVLTVLAASRAIRRK
jgi:hypothetical protein